MGPQNVIQGNQDIMNFPEPQFDDSQFEEIKKTARFSKSAEFKALKEYIEGRIVFYSTFLPTGENPSAQKELSNEEIGEHWRVANLVTGEMKQLINIYENAAETVKDETARRAAMKKASEEL